MKTFGLDIIHTVFGPVLRPRFVLSIPFWVLDFLRESGFSKIHGSIECKYRQLDIEFGHRSESQDNRVLQPSLLTPNIHRWPRWIFRPLARGWNCSNFGRNLQDSSMDEDLKTINDKMYKWNYPPNNALQTKVISVDAINETYVLMYARCRASPSANRALKLGQ